MSSTVPAWLTSIVSTRTAWVTIRLRARNTSLDGNTVANSQRCDSFTEGNDFAC